MSLQWQDVDHKRTTQHTLILDFTESFFLVTKKYGRVEIWLQYSWPRHLVDVSGQLHAPAALPHGEIARGTNCIGGGVGPRAVWMLCRREKSYPHLESNPDRTDRSPSLYRLSYSGSLRIFYGVHINKTSAIESSLLIELHFSRYIRCVYCNIIRPM
jgi:hypothetical protein